MESNIFFEDIDLSTKRLPIIFHKRMKCNHITAAYINWHENIEIIRVLSGSGVILCGERIVEASCGDIIVINANLPHCFSSPDIMEYACLIIDRKFILKSGLDTNEFNFAEKIEDDQEALKLFDSIYDQYTVSSELIDIYATVFPLIHYLYRHYSAPKSTNSYKDSIKVAISYIHNHIQKEITLDEIASQVGMSKYYFVRKFKKMTGYTPMQYINIHRCELAKSLISNNVQLKSVATLTGFESQSYFTKVFKKTVGVLPSEYKKSD